MLKDLAALNKKSHHQLAQRWVLDRLENPETPAGWSEGMESLQVDLFRVRRDMALGFEAALAASGKVTMEEARDWADRNFRKD